MKSYFIQLFTRLFGSNSPEYYKFSIGQKIVLKSRRSFGYGIRPEGIVSGYTDDGNYKISMTQDLTGDFFEWMKTGKVRDDVKRITLEQKHFKSNIENHFKKASLKKRLFLFLFYLLKDDVELVELFRGDF